MRRLADWIGGAVSGVVAYRLWKRRQQPAVATGPTDAEADDRAEELRAKLAETRATAETPPAEASDDPESVEERRRRVHEEGRAAIDEMRDS
jgi:hypothetical protein